MVAVLAIAACGGSDGLETAPDFEVTLYQGEADLGASTLKLSDLRGKPMVLNFWAGLCPPCRAEMPEFQEFYDEYRDRVNLLGLDVGPFLVGLGSAEDAKNLLDDLNITYPSGSPPDASTPKAYQVVGMPSTFFITADGKIFRRWDAGLLTRTKLTEVTEAMLAASNNSSGPGT